MKGAKQTTLRDQVAVSGIGVHSGSPVTLTLHPADDDSGIVFQRVSADGTAEREIRADVRAVTATEFATVLGDASGPLCSTAEHLLAALRGIGVDNVVVEIDGPEVPIIDGSAAPFVDAIGDLALAGQPLLATYRTVRGGHKLNHAVLSALMADRSAWRVIEATEATEPARRPRGRASIGAGLLAPAYGPEMA